MKSTRILLTIEHQLHAQLLKRFLNSEPEFELVGEAQSVLEILVLINREKPDLWIHSWEQSAALEGVLSHVYGCHPNLSVVRFCPNEQGGCAQIQLDSLATFFGFAKSLRQMEESA
ncbi:hypothetical protein Mal15_37350 [Stieleria maiorica]|uniref:Response regulatory domain-containing protein n=1 Tax=Stieleria maiorica TaxID=2795974 RepID=A0A5B9MGP1_9BACT|nr:hypothetical protein [Stieleria maiorica]QEF99669.1 hypothetical protein Mal15_37350 [Stieleria maiorica]